MAVRNFGKVFDEIAVDYDRYRPGYPDQLISYACQAAHLESGDRVLELGCGSGQLTKALAERGLQVTALEPGKKLIALAEKNLTGLGNVDFIQATFEDADLPRGSYKAVFSASAFHWIDPGISWQKSADVLIQGGVIALLQHFGLRESRTSEDLNLQLAALKKVDPEAAEQWPHYYALAEIIDGVEKRRHNISSAWSWLGSYDVSREYAGRLFGKVKLAVLPTLIEQTADQAVGMLQTLSFYSRLTATQRGNLDQEFKTINDRLRRPMRSSIVSVLMTAAKNLK